MNSDLLRKPRQAAWLAAEFTVVPGAQMMTNIKHGTNSLNIQRFFGLYKEGQEKLKEKHIADLSAEIVFGDTSLVTGSHLTIIGRAWNREAYQIRVLERCKSDLLAILQSNSLMTTMMYKEANIISILVTVSWDPIPEIDLNVYPFKDTYNPFADNICYVPETHGDITDATILGYCLCVLRFLYELTLFIPSAQNAPSKSHEALEKVLNNFGDLHIEAMAALRRQTSVRQRLADIADTRAKLAEKKIHLHPIYLKHKPNTMESLNKINPPTTPTKNVNETFQYLIQSFKPKPPKK
jgi:hypothetical protein